MNGTVVEITHRRIEDLDLERIGWRLSEPPHGAFERRAVARHEIRRAKQRSERVRRVGLLVVLVHAHDRRQWKRSSGFDRKK